MSRGTNKSLPWACHLSVVVELESLSDPKSSAGWDLSPWQEFNLAGLVEEERADEGQPLALQVGGWA